MSAQSTLGQSDKSFGAWVGLVLALCLTQPCLASEIVRFRNGRVLLVEGHEALGSRTTLILKDNGRMEIESEWIETIGTYEEFKPATVIEAESEGLKAYRNYGADEFRDLVRENARKFSLDEKLLVSMIRAESNFDPLAVSPRGAQGLMQLMPDTVSAYKVKDPFNPRENLEAGAMYLKDLLQQFNQNLILALAAYNAGPTVVLTYNGVPPFPETIRYVRKVLALKEERR